MEIGLRSWCVSRDFDEVIAVCNELDVKGVQIHPVEARLYESTDDELRAFRDRAEDAGLTIISSNTGPNLVDPAVRDESLLLYEKLIHAAAVMGHCKITGESKALGEGQSIEDGWEKFLANLRTVLDMCEAEGVDFCLEVWPPNLVTTIEHTERALAAVTSPRLFVNLDTGNMTGGGSDAVEAARRLGPRVAHVHAKDWNRASGSHVKEGERLLGDGDVDFAGVIRELDAAGYDGWLVIERIRATDRVNDARVAVKRLRGILEAM